MHGVDAAGDPALTRQRNRSRATIAEGVEKILDRLSREQRGVTANLAGRQVGVAASQNGEPVLAGRAFDHRGSITAEGKACLDRIW